MRIDIRSSPFVFVSTFSDVLKVYWSQLIFRVEWGFEVLARTDRLSPKIYVGRSTKIPII